MEHSNKTQEDKTTATPPMARQPSPPTSQLIVRPPDTLDAIEQQVEQNQPRLEASHGALDHQLWEMEANLSHQFATMQSKLDSSFSSLRDEVSDLGDSLEESMDRLEGTVDRFVSTVKWYIALGTLTTLVGIAFLIWRIVSG